MNTTSDKQWARLALKTLLRRIACNIANDRLVAALIAAAVVRARARKQR